MKISNRTEYRLFIAAIAVWFWSSVVASFYFGTAWIFLGVWVGLAAIATYMAYFRDSVKDTILDFLFNLFILLCISLSAVLGPEIWQYKENKNV